MFQRLNKNKFLFIFFIIFLACLTANKSVSEEIELEGFSLNDDLLYILKVKNLDDRYISFSYPDKKYASITLNKRNNDLKKYDELLIYFEWESVEFKVESIHGVVGYTNFKECIKDKAKITKEISNTLGDTKYKLKENEIKNDEGSHVNKNIFFLTNGSLISIDCYDYKNSKYHKKKKKVSGGSDYVLAISIQNDEFHYWLSNLAYERKKTEIINNFLIEDITINQKLINHPRYNEIKLSKKYNFRETILKDYYNVSLKENLKKYDNLALTFNKKDKNFETLIVRGLKKFENYELCKKEKANIFYKVMRDLETGIESILKTPLIQETDKYFTVTDYFIFEKGDITISCTINEITDIFKLEVGIYSNTIREQQS
tara:strand:- start:383 stop:1501 length:1119 start_codon:yes stop_codon:yes gene_type:complete